ncbi:hypothetical protein ABFX02_05G038200 [Erythranthe guttata]
MAQLYGMVNCFRYPRTSIRMTLSSPLDPNHRVHHHANLNFDEKTTEMPLLGLYAMNGGEGPNSYAQNSSYQRGVVDAAKPIIEEEIATKLDVGHVFSTHVKPFRIADFGCSTGHNSFPAMQIITESVQKKFRSETSQIPDFQVLFNDQVFNDFNTLFRSIPPQKNYHAAAVAGSFHERLLPKASLDFAYCSCALNWISEVPKAVRDDTSPAWNKGRVHYTGAVQEVFEAYSNRYANDIGSFLEARAEELVSGGLMTLLVPAAPCFEHSETFYTTQSELELIGSCLVDMAKKGLIGEEKVDTFNFPLYFTIPQELKAIIERSNSFSIERMEILNNPGKCTLRSADARATYLRATCEGLLKNHFGSEVMDELFDRYTKKIAASPLFLDPDNEKSIIILVILKRKAE